MKPFIHDQVRLGLSKPEHQRLPVGLHGEESPKKKEDAEHNDQEGQYPEAEPERIGKRRAGRVQTRLGQIGPALLRSVMGVMMISHVSCPPFDPSPVRHCVASSEGSAALCAVAGFCRSVGASFTKRSNGGVVVSRMTVVLSRVPSRNARIFRR